MCCWIIAILKLIGAYDCEKNCNDILNLKRLEIKLEDALRIHVNNVYVENIRELFAENICKYKDKYENSYNLIYAFLKREVYRDLEIIE